MAKKNSKVNMQQSPEAVLTELINRANPGRSFKVGDLEFSNVRPHEGGEEPDARARNTDVDVKVVATGQEITLNYGRIEIDFTIDEQASTEAMSGLDPEDPNFPLLVGQRIAAIAGAYVHVDWESEEPRLDDEHVSTSDGGIAFAAEHLIYQGGATLGGAETEPEPDEDGGDGEVDGDDVP